MAGLVPAIRALPVIDQGCDKDVGAHGTTPWA